MEQIPFPSNFTKQMSNETNMFLNPKIREDIFHPVSMLLTGRNFAFVRKKISSDFQ